jgi:type VI secretion system protein ImpA
MDASITEAQERRSGLEMTGKLSTESIERYQALDHLINRYDTEGAGPLRKGEEPFRWSVVESESRALLTQMPDLRIAIWLLRSLVIQRDLMGLCEGLEGISSILARPVEQILPVSHEDASPWEEHAISLGWLGGETFLALLHGIRAHPEAPLKLGQLTKSAAAASTLTTEQRDAAERWLRQARDQLISIRACILDAGGFWDRDPVIAIELLSDLIRLISPGDRKSTSVTEEIIGEISQPEGAGTPGFESPQLNSRESVKEMLSRLLSYYEKYEPAHPAPVLLKCLARMVDASFEEVLKELYAEGTSLVMRIKKPEGQG